MGRGALRSAWRPQAPPALEVVEVRARAAKRGAWVQLAALALGVVYMLITDEPIRTGWFLATLAAAAPLGLALLLPWEDMLRRRSGAWVLLGRYALLALLISLAIATTGGPASQLWLLYALIVLFVGWCFDTLTVAAFSAVMLAGYTVTMGASGGVPARGVLFARLATLALVTAGIALLSSESRRYAEGSLVAARDAAALAEARLALAEQARHLSAVQGEFVSTVSHELKTPLTAIIGSLSTLQRGVAMSPEMADQLISAAARHARRLNALIEDLLTASRLGEGQVSVRLDNVDALAVASDVAAQLQVARPEGQLTLVLEGGEPPLVSTDPDHLHRVLLNLADNAMKYGGAPVRIRVGRVGDRVRFVVEDKGPGIDPVDHIRIFERFAQLESGQRKQVGGTGLGLHICAGLVGRLGGHLVVCSMPGEGAAFGFTLPIAPSGRGLLDERAEVGPGQATEAAAPAR